MELAPEDCVYLSLFTGPNGTGAGLHYAGWRAADCVEFDGAACDTIRANFGDGVNILNRDIRQQMVEHLSRPYYPLAVYTWPCTHYSNIGAIHGAQTGDDLYLHAVRNHALLWPEVALVENVLGMHQKFPVVMEDLAVFKNVCKRLHVSETSSRNRGAGLLSVRSTHPPDERLVAVWQEASRVVTRGCIPAERAGDGVLGS